MWTTLGSETCRKHEASPPVDLVSIADFMGQWTQPATGRGQPINKHHTPLGRALQPPLDTPRDSIVGDAVNQYRPRRSA